MQRREFLQLAQTYKPGKSKIASFFVSEKLDGTRCLWDGGASRGMRTEEVPYASVVDPKTGRPKAKVKPFATGLWSRYGNPIMAPDWFLDSLPSTPLDGELWAGRGKFQLCRSICGGDTPDPRFSQIKYAVYSCPPLRCLTSPGEIKNPNFHCIIDPAVNDWLLARVGSYLNSEATFEVEYAHLHELLEGRQYAFAHPQVRLPDDEVDARDAVEEYLFTTIQGGGEGVVIRDPRGIWTPKRVNTLLKYKECQDREVIITGFTSGRKTERGSKHLGRIGALITNCDGQRLEISGLTDEERLFSDDVSTVWAEKNPGVDMPVGTEGKHFKVGDVITILFREYTDSNLPKEARFFRRRDVE